MFILMMILLSSSLVMLAPIAFLWPFVQLVKQKRKPQKTKFATTDLFALVFLVQLPFAVLSQMRTDIEAIPISVVIFIGLLMVAIWYIGLREVNYFGIASNLKRIVAISFTFPIGFISGFLILFSFEFALNRYQHELSGYLLLISIPVLALLFFSARWIIPTTNGEDTRI